MDNSKRVSVGVDMGATHIRICLLAADGTVIETTKEKTISVVSNGLVDGLIHFINTYLLKHNVQVSNIVIGFPASVSNDKKTIISVPNLPCKSSDFHGLAEKLEEHFACRVILERDVNLQLFYDVSEHQLKNNLVLGFYLGTGFGFSIWFNGAPFVGAHGVAGELGHIPYGDHSATCGCGNHGCVETNCSGVALRRWYESETRSYPIDDIFTYALDEPVIQTLIDSCSKAIATGINLFDPDVALLGGGVLDMANFPLEELIRRVSTHMRKPLPYEKVKFMKASSSSFNGAIGAARMALDLSK
ncbi:allose kinase [Tolumonas osonensis]|uniref:Allose kinase n=1 Tax=Tolumonas osonensis TaxID=675874 RepID=A0A841GN75_9GAMM|nr:allose kinase [Tolumonas osonensis]MBB6054933.1 allose kinase [Tolumonas osonensis]